MKFQKAHFVLFILLLTLLQVKGQDIPEQPEPPRLVNDFAELLSEQEKHYLEKKLVAFNDTNSTQIAIVIVNSLKGYDIADFAQRLAQKWEIGQKKYDNGAIILLKPKTASSRGEVNIDVGYGLEPLIPDITVKRIVENEMIPHFRNNDYFKGLNAASDVIISLAAGHFSAREYQGRTKRGTPFGFFIPIVIILFVISMLNRRRGNYYHTTNKGRNLPLWTALWLGSTMGSRSSGSFSDFSSGSGGFGGGGFGGFGGGSFGGGGASGSW